MLQAGCSVCFERYLHHCGSRGSPSSSSARNASRNFMSLRLRASNGPALTSQDDPTYAYCCVGFVLRDMLCICYSPDLTLYSTPTPSTGQKSLSCAFFLFSFRFLC